MKHSWIARLLVLILMLSMVTAQAAETQTFTDSTGRTVTIPADISRVAPSGAMAQIILFALAPDALVGLTSPWTEEAKAFLGDYAHLPVLGQLYGSGDLNLEEIARLDPQVIIDLGEAKASIVEDMDAIQAQIGIPTVHIGAKLSSYADTYCILGDLLRQEDRANALAAYCETAYARTQAIMEAVGENRVRILYCMGTNGTNVIARGSFHAELIDMLADNVAIVDNPSSKGTGNEVSMEQILLWDPDVIIFAPGSVYNSVETDPLWRELTAIAAGRYVQAPTGPYQWMGFPSAVQRILGMLWLCDVLYPGYCQDDLYTQVREYFDLFYHWELTAGQFEALMADARMDIR